jgi:voltage-gated sodium channel
VSTSTAGRPESARVAYVRRMVESEWFQRLIIGVIVANAILLGLETSKSVMASYGWLLQALDQIALSIFVAEFAAKLYVYRLSFFRNAWNIFDFVIIGISLAPIAEGLSVLRALRILRALRLVSLVPSMRLVVQALLGSIPAMSSVIGLSMLIFYVTAVMATKFFGERFDEFFGTLGKSFYTLFQIMTLESWSAGIVRPVMEVYPYAWAFFVPFILIATFAVLNLFIAIVVNSMTEASKEAEAARPAAEDDLAAEIRALRMELAGIRAALSARSDPTDAPQRDSLSGSQRAGR